MALNHSTFASSAAAPGMGAAAAGAFTPPTPEQVAAWLERNPLRPPTKAILLLPLLLLGGMTALFLWSTSQGNPLLDLLGLLAWVAVIAGLALAAGSRARRARRLERMVVGVHETAATRRHAAALRQAWDGLPHVVSHPELHGRLVAAAAHCLDQLKAYDAAIVAFDHLCQRLHDDDPARVQIRLHLALAQLQTDRLADADDGLRGVRGAVEKLDHAGLRAVYRMARLLQQVRTHHFADAVTSAGTLAPDLRPLGVEAGYGHALMALSFHQLAQQEAGAAAAADDAPSAAASPAGDAAADEPGAAPGPSALAARAAQWWEQATLLMPVAALVDRFPELSALAASPGMPVAPRRPSQLWRS